MAEEKASEGQAREAHAAVSAAVAERWVLMVGRLACFCGDVRHFVGERIPRNQ